MPDDLRDRLDQIRAREAAATAGPWVWGDCGIEAGDEFVFWPANAVNDPENAREALGACGRRTEPDAEANMSFLAHAREDVPRLLAEVDRLAAERDAALATLARVRELADRWAALAPADDWGDNMADTMLADTGRAVLAALAGPAGAGRTQDGA